MPTINGNIPYNLGEGCETEKFKAELDVHLAEYRELRAEILCHIRSVHTLSAAFVGGLAVASFAIVRLLVASPMNTSTAFDASNSIIVATPITYCLLLLISCMSSWYCIVVSNYYRNILKIAFYMADHLIPRVNFIFGFKKLTILKWEIFIRSEGKLSKAANRDEKLKKFAYFHGAKSYGLAVIILPMLIAALILIWQFPWMSLEGRELWRFPLWLLCVVIFYIAASLGVRCQRAYALKVQNLVNLEGAPQWQTEDQQ